MKEDKKKHKSIDSQILEAIKVLGKGTIFVPTDFLDLGNRQVIDVVFHRLVQKKSFAA